MKFPNAASVMQCGIERGESNSFVPAKRELTRQRARVPKGCTLYLVYGHPNNSQMCMVWPAMNGHPDELRMIRRTCRSRGWRCTYYVVEM